MAGTIFVIGTGPGSPDWLAPGAQGKLLCADIILGYHKYLQQIETLAPNTPREGSGMRHEIERAQRAVELADQGKTVAVVLGGGAGLFGLGGGIFGKPGEKGHKFLLGQGVARLNGPRGAPAIFGGAPPDGFLVLTLTRDLAPP